MCICLGKGGSFFLSRGTPHIQIDASHLTLQLPVSLPVPQRTEKIQWKHMLPTNTYTNIQVHTVLTHIHTSYSLITDKQLPAHTHMHCIHIYVYADRQMNMFIPCAHQSLHTHIHISALSLTPRHHYPAVLVIRPCIRPFV